MTYISGWREYMQPTNCDVRNSWSVRNRWLWLQTWANLEGEHDRPRPILRFCPKTTRPLIFLIFCRWSSQLTQTVTTQSQSMSLELVAIDSATAATCDRGGKLPRKEVTDMCSIVDCEASIVTMRGTAVRPDEGWSFPSAGVLAQRNLLKLVSL
jgi:hypothetical protein